MSLNPQIQDLGAKVKLTWTPDLTGEGYAFTVDGVRVSRTFKSDASSTTFQKPDSGTHRYGVQKMDAVDPLEEASWPAAPDPDPDPGDYLWDDPVLSNPLTRTVSSSAPSIPKGSGQDLKIIVAPGMDRSIGQVEGYNDVFIDGFRIVGGSQNSSGHIVPRENTGTFFVKNGRIELVRQGDALTVRWRQPKMYVVNTYLEVISEDDVVHSDGWQSQEGIINELGFDCVTIKTDYQGIFQSNEVQNQGPARSKIDKTILSRLLFLPQDGPSYPATWWFKAFPPRPGADPVGLTEMFEVWAPLQDILGHVYPNGHTWRAWDGSATKYGAFLETKHHPTLNKSVPFCRFSTTADKVPAGKPLAGQTCGDVGVRGDGGIWCYQNLSEVPSYVGSTGV